MAQTEINPDGQPAGRAGQLADLRDVAADSGFNAEASAAMRFGEPVARKTTDPTGRGALRLALVTDQVWGILAWGFNHAGGTGGDLDTNGDMKPGSWLDVIVKGRMLVTVEEAVVPTDRAFIRVVIAGSEVLGAFRKSADASDCIDVSRNARFVTAAAAGGLAWLEFDFTIKAG